LARFEQLEIELQPRLEVLAKEDALALQAEDEHS